MTDDWRAIQAERYRQAKAQQPKQSSPALGTCSRVLKALVTSAAPSASASGKQPALGSFLLQSYTAAVSAVSAIRKAYRGTTRRHVLVVLTLLVALIPSAIQQWQLYQANKALNRGPTPDSNLRKAHEHRAYMLGKKDFVDVYAANQQIKLNSSTVEGGWDVEHVSLHKGGSITRCATTQYAAVTYFCGKALADTEYFGRLPGFNSSKQLSDFIRDVEHKMQADSNSSARSSGGGGAAAAAAAAAAAGENSKSSSSSSAGGVCPLWPQYIFRCNLHEATDFSLGHTFVLHILPDGACQVYQSFIGHYTLQTYLKDHGPMSYQQFMNFLDNIQLLENATEWTHTEDAAYKQNFMVSLRKSSSKDGPLGGWKDLHKRKDAENKQHIKFIAEPVCVAGMPKPVVVPEKLLHSQQMAAI